MSVRIITGDMLSEIKFLPDESIDCIITDPPYEQTAMVWDRWPKGWPDMVRRVLRPSGSMWVFGTLRMFMKQYEEFGGWKLAQDVIWEKHNGTNMFADSFRRVHEQVVQFYKKEAPWGGVFKNPLYTYDATARAVRRKQRPAQWGDIDASSFRSEDGGPRLMRSVMFCRSDHGSAEHPTQKPIATVIPLIEYSCPVDGLVLDPFFGGGTTGVAAQRLNRDCIGIEINPDYAGIARRRVADDASLLTQNAAE